MLKPDLTYNLTHDSLTHLAHRTRFFKAGTFIVLFKYPGWQASIARAGEEGK